MENSENDLPTGLTIDDLPNELLSEILTWLTSFRREEQGELDNAMKVCQRWYNIVDGWIGRSVTCSKPMLIHPSNPDLTKEGLELISEIGVRLFEIGSDENRNLLEAPSATLPSFKRPYLLRFLIISGAIHPDLFNNLVKNTINLCGFGISLVALSQLRNSDLKHVSLKFPRLKMLHVDSSPRTPNDDLNDVPSLPNLRTLLGENKFRNLTSISFEFPVKTFGDLETVNILLPFIQDHYALTHVYVEMIFPNETVPVDGRVYQEEMKHIMAGINSRECSRFLKEIWLCTRSENGRRRFGSYPQLQVWNEFLLKPMSLIELNLEIGPISNDHLRTICTRNGPTLEKFKIDQEYFQMDETVHPPLDCSALSPLQCLPKLELRLHFQHEIIGIRHLPVSLVSISITGKMRSEEFHDLLLNLPNLRSIGYSNYWNRSNNDENEGYTVRIDTLRQLVAKRKVEYLHLYDGVMGRNFPVGGIPNGDPEKPRILTCYVPNCIVWKLTRSGYYFNAIYSCRNGNVCTTGSVNEDD